MVSENTVGFHTSTQVSDDQGVVQTFTSDNLAGQHNQLREINARRNQIIDSFVRELLDLDAFQNLDPEVQEEVRQKYPQFFG